MSALYVGLMSGTSIDGVDAVLVDFFKDEKGNLQSKIIESFDVDFDKETKALLHELCLSSYDEIEKCGVARVAIAKTEAKAVLGLLQKAKVEPKDIIAIGSHGQTVRHRPEKGFSLQLDEGPLLAALTGIDVVNNFRAADIAFGGNGAPLTQAFHKMQFASTDKVSMVLNLGGIANLTVIDKDAKHQVLTAFDIGPANTLIDAAMRLLLNKNFDEDAKVARSGVVIPMLLAKYLSAPYLQLEPPKSTGRETFNVDFIKDELLLSTQDKSFIPDFIATLTEFTVVSCVNAIRQCLYKYKIDGARLIICGGGAYSPYIVEKMTNTLSKNKVEVITSDKLGANAKLIEAHAFAYFAYKFVNREALDLDGTTGAKRPSILGCLCPTTYKGEPFVG